MTLYAGISTRHVNTYHQNNSLIFQFILVEFLETFAEMQKLHSLCSGPSSIKQMENDLHPIEGSLQKLVGATKDCMRLFSWDFNEGLLVKLRTYCALFLQNADTDEKELMALQHYIDKVWHNCLQAIDAIQEIPQDRTQLLSALDKASTAMQRFAKLIARLILQFKNDENVLFYILRNHTAFDRTYGNRFVVKTFSKIYPKGLKDVLQFLVGKYTERGFKNVLPAIYSAATAIEASA